MDGYKFCRWVAGFVIAGSMLVLAGCQGLAPSGSGNGGVALSSTNQDFGTVTVGSTINLQNSLSNGGTSSVTISSIQGTGGDFQLTGLSLPLVLTAGQSAPFTIEFKPKSPGSSSATIAYMGDGGQQYATLQVSGKAVAQGQLTSNPGSIDFGNVQVGANAGQSVTLTNTGATSLTISAASVTGNGFSFSGLSLPITLSAGQTTSFMAKFAPNVAGTANGSMTITSDAPDSPLTIPLTGTGVTQGSLSPNPSSLAFGNVQVGNNSSLQETLTNTGGSSVTISAASVSGSGFSINGLTLPLTLSPGQNTSFTVKFAPSAAGAASGNVTLTSTDPNSPLTIALTGTGVAPGTLSANPSSLAFGNVQVGSNSSLQETLTNTGGSSVTITAASVTGSGFSINGLTLPLTLNAGQNTSFTVKFAPTAAGAASGSVTITSNASNSPLSISLSGIGVLPGALSPNPSSLAFGNVQIGSNASLQETLTNTGGSPVTISAASVSGAGFSYSGLTLPLTLNAGQNTTFTVKFAPSVAGAASGSVSITSDAPNSPLTIPLTGTGVTQGALSPNPSSLAFGNVQVGSNSSLQETLTNTGGSSVTITAASVTGSGFSISGLTLPLTLNAGQNTSFTVKFAPSVAGAASGNVTLTSTDPKSPLTIPLTGTGVAPGTLSANPSSLAFGSVQVGSSANLLETLTNTGGSSVTITQANVTGTAFSISGLTLPATLTPSQSVTFTATFAPSATGSASGSLSIVSNASNSNLNIPLSGTGTASGQLAVTPATLNFGTVTVGSSSPLSGSLTASGAAVTVSSASINSSEFTLSGIVLPKTISAGQSVPFTVTFAPKASGAASASLTFTSDASNSPTVETLTGTGQASGQHSVDLSWDASSGAVSYNVYRKLPSDSSYTQINFGGTAITYTDNTVTAGQTYNYVVTAVDASSQESGYSNMAQAIVPSP